MLTDTEANRLAETLYDQLINGNSGHVVNQIAEHDSTTAAYIVSEIARLSEIHGGGLTKLNAVLFNRLPPEGPKRFG